ncbi:MAG: hypothetical protein BGO88_04855 [Flavobacterium sp. 38-13]|uniref:hypothetical protein n=1 Tax=Flavobacterium sp. 38-13 TaxID=1896168 RepID=UPI000968FEDA|nr:hypothetical protein [Flavobacterium sp. 38-13]OJX55547.1 MAG: hypothetical protein BGO88_04855 [Flavobacterium sp. 38-13]
MREKIIKFFQEELPSNKSEQFNRIFEFYRQSPGKSVASERMYNASGYSQTNLEALKYDLQKIHNIKDSELVPRKKAVSKLPSEANDFQATRLQLFCLLMSFAGEAELFNEEKENEIKQYSEEQFIEKAVEYFLSKSISLTEIADAALKVESNELFELLKEVIRFVHLNNTTIDTGNTGSIPVNDPVVVTNDKTEKQEGVKLREEFPFLNNPDCPDLAHVLVGRKIAAWIRYQENHKKLEQFDAGEIELSEEEKVQVSKDAVSDFSENQAIYDELNNYKEHGFFLQKHPLFRTIRLKEEVEKMTQQQLINFKNSSVKFFSENNAKLKADGITEKRTLELTERIEARKEKLDLVDEKLGVKK